MAYYIEYPGGPKKYLTVKTQTNGTDQRTFHRNSSYSIHSQ